MSSTALFVNSIAGSSRFIFTGINCFLMLLGAYVSALPAALLVVAFFVCKACVWSMPITAGIPTLLSAVGFAAYHNPRATLSKLMLLGYPALCIVLFNLHPVGSLAMAYSLYWIIPMACYLALHYGFNRILCASLGSTFIAHATGSIMWLYLQQTTPDYWLTLIPLVAAERIVFALGAVCAYVALHYASTLLLAKSSIAQEQSLNQ